MASGAGRRPRSWRGAQPAGSGLAGDGVTGPDWRPFLICRHLATLRLCSSRVRREGVAAAAVGDEVQIVDVGRVEHRLERGAPGIADRTRRQTRRSDRCCRRCRAASRARVSSRSSGAVAIGQAVDHRRIGLQAHAVAQPVEEHRGDRAALLRHAGLLVDDRGEDQRLLPVGRAAGPRRAPATARRAAGACRAACAAPARRARRRARRSRSPAAGCLPAAARAARRSARRSRPSRRNTSATVRPSATVSRRATVSPRASMLITLAGVARGREGVLAGLEGAVLALEPDREAEQPRPLDHAGGVQARGDRVETGAARQHDHGLAHASGRARPGTRWVWVQHRDRHRSRQRGQHGQDGEQLQRARAHAAGRLSARERRTKIRLALVPPKPKELDSAARTSRRRAS